MHILYRRGLALRLQHSKIPNTTWHSNTTQHQHVVRSCDPRHPANFFVYSSSCSLSSLFNPSINMATYHIHLQYNTTDLPTGTDPVDNKSDQHPHHQPPTPLRQDKLDQDPTLQAGETQQDEQSAVAEPYVSVVGCTGFPNVWVPTAEELARYHEEMRLAQLMPLPTGDQDDDIGDSLSAQPCNPPAERAGDKPEAWIQDKPLWHC
ncbi:hypothetical protein F5884DRAFT_57316 [Xylogone sp. PMI_703]|nr:hypothetical protein F5884DRAFT_57316 [Xylogone sp. PMI_703]